MDQVEIDLLVEGYRPTAQLPLPCVVIPVQRGERAALLQPPGKTPNLEPHQPNTVSERMFGEVTVEGVKVITSRADPHIVSRCGNLRDPQAHFGLRAPIRLACVCREQNLHGMKRLDIAATAAPLTSSGEEESVTISGFRPHAKGPYVATNPARS